MHYERRMRGRSYKSVAAQGGRLPKAFPQPADAPTEGQKSGSATKEWTETNPKAGNSERNRQLKEQQNVI